TPLAGVIGGEPWELSFAEADAELSNDSELFVEAHGETSSTRCGVHISATSFALLKVPTAIGEYPFSPTINATFVLNDRNQSNLVATKGKVVVESVTEAEVIARAFVEYDPSNRIDGRFTITLCN